MDLHLSYRPSTLEEVVGNQTTVKMLQSFFARPEGPPHVMLFSGPKGCGKTTLARIIAKKLKIHDMDMQELNSADYRGIDDARELIRRAHLQAIGGKHRLWLLDEVHMLTSQAQSCLLKLLEEPPGHVYFCLATTDPQKLLPTLRNRCTELKVGAVAHKEMVVFLAEIVEAEGADVQDEVLVRIASESEGTPRTALVLLGRVISLPKAEQLEAVQKSVLDEEEAINLCRAILKREKWDVIGKMIGDLMATQTAETVRQLMLAYFTKVLIDPSNKRMVDNCYLVLVAFERPMYDTGWAGVARACYEATASQR